MYHVCVENRNCIPAPASIKRIDLCHSYLANCIVFHVKYMWNANRDGISRSVCDGSMTSRTCISSSWVQHNNEQFPSITMQPLRSITLTLTPRNLNHLTKPAYRSSSSLLTRPASSKAKILAAGRLTQVQRQLLKTAASRKEYNMASDDSKKQNNADFQLSEVFNVKDKVVLITGRRSSLEKKTEHDSDVSL